MFTETSKLPSGSEIQVGLGTITGIEDFDIPLTKYGGGACLPHIWSIMPITSCARRPFPASVRAFVRACVGIWVWLTLCSWYRIIDIGIRANYWYLCYALPLIVCFASFLYRPYQMLHRSTSNMQSSSPSQTSTVDVNEKGRQASLVDVFRCLPFAQSVHAFTLPPPVIPFENYETHAILPQPVVDQHSYPCLPVVLANISHRPKHYLVLRAEHYQSRSPPHLVGDNLLLKAYPLVNK